MRRTFLGGSVDLASGPGWGAVIGMVCVIGAYVSAALSLVLPYGVATRMRLLSVPMGLIALIASWYAQAATTPSDRPTERRASAWGLGLSLGGPILVVTWSFGSCVSSSS